jgi:hypothetical protein
MSIPSSDALHAADVAAKAEGSTAESMIQAAVAANAHQHDGSLEDDIPMTFPQKVCFFSFGHW